jgi:hypothetical protein
VRDRKPSTTRRLVMPVVLAVMAITTVVAVATTSSGCGDDLPAPRDAGPDAPVDTPLA